jgi:tetratricopeptide (TPR) repeat protein
MARKPTGNDPEAEARRAFGQLLKWHLGRGTRPDGVPDLNGVRWLKRLFAEEAGTTPRSLTNWLNGTTLPETLSLVGQALFGNEPANKTTDKYAKFRHEFRESYRLSGGGERAIGPQSFVHDPGRCLGRDEQIAKLVAALLSNKTGASILVLGGAGYGKTTLTEKVGVDRQVEAYFGARRWFVELERANEATTAVAGIANAIGLEPAGLEPAALLAAVHSRLAASPGLLILDNLETSFQDDRRRMEQALCDLVAIEGLAVMASLRGQESIGAVDWSNQVSVEPLPPDVAREVFLSIARNIRDDDPDLNYFIDELEGIPLALRLVAQRASLKSNLAELRREWERFGALLATEPGREATKLNSLEKSIEFSLASPRLHENGKRLFSLLGQLPAGLRLDDRDILLGEAGFEAADQLRVVGLLRDRNGRVGLLSPIRDIARRRHRPNDVTMKEWSAYYLKLVTEEGQKIGTVCGSKAIMRLLPEMANVGAAIAASVDNSEGRQKAVAALESLDPAMRFSGVSCDAAIDALERACVQANDLLGQATCILTRSGAARVQSRIDVARTDLEKALSLVRGQGEDKIEAECLRGLAELARMQDDPEASDLFKKSRELFQRGSTEVGEARCLWGLAELERKQGAYEPARVLYREALNISRRTGRLSGEGQCLWGLAQIALEEHDPEAVVLYDKAREAFQQGGWPTGEAHCLFGLAEVARIQGPSAQAHRLYEQARDIYERAGNVSDVARCDEALSH